MSSYVDMSLEDIIQKKKREKKRPKNIAETTKLNKQLPSQKRPITDARNKIISNKRNQITDAREKLAELAKKKDARLKLEQLRRKRAMAQSEGNNVFQSHRKFINKDRVFTDRSRQVVSQPLAKARIPTKRRINNTKKFMESRSIESRPLSKLALKPILRTVENDLEIIDEPMEDEYPSSNTSLLNRKASLQLKIIAHNNDLRENRNNITQKQYIHRTAITEKEPSPPRLPSILKKRPIAALRNETKSEKSEKPVALEYRIIVSNLRNTVTGGDIQELFGDVGGMVDSRLVRPGTAEVIYKTVEDAQKAVDLYHNRQLDGQPMNCLLVTPRANASHSKSNSKHALYSTNSNVEPDISTFHKVLFSNF